MSKKALSIVVATIVALSMVAMATAVTFDRWNTIPTIINAYVEPTKVRPGDMMLVVALVQDDYGIDKVTAKMPFEGGYDMINLELVEGTAFNGTWKGTWTVHDTIYKEYTTNITAFSKSGLSSSVNLTFWDPSITIVSPLDRTYPTSTVNFHVSLSEAGNWCGFSLDGAANVTMTKYNSTYFNYTKAGLGDGSHDIRFSCNDTLGDMNSTLRYFTVAEPPTVSLKEPVDYYGTSSATITFNCSAADNSGNITNVTLYGNWSGWDAKETNSSASLNGKDVLFSKTITPDGTYVWNCRACDKSSNCGFASTNWNYRRSINISGSSSDLTNYPVKVTVAYDSDMQPDFDDVRFTTSDGTTLLNYWRENYTALSSAIFWVNVISLPNNTNTTIYMYYGDPSASSASNRSAIFSYKTYDFMDSINNSAYYGKDLESAVPVAVDRSTWEVPGTEFSSGDYTNISTSDNSRVSITVDTGNTQQLVHDFVFKMDEVPNQIYLLNFSWEGYGIQKNEPAVDNDLRMYLLNTSSNSFELKDSKLDNSCPGPADCTMNSTLDSTGTNISNYINGTGHLRFLVQKYESECAPTETNCLDTIDNDCDGWTDSQDADCEDCTCAGTGYETKTIQGDTVYVDCNYDKCWSPAAPSTYIWGPTTNEPDDSCIGKGSAYPACDYCDTLNQGGFTDWTLPDLTTLDNLCNSDSCPSGDCFGETTGDYYWTSTEFDINYAKDIYPGFGCSTGDKPKDSSKYVRCVRSGSSPYLYSYDGSGYEFISDFGASGKENERTYYVEIPDAKIAWVDGKYRIKITEELDEIAYLDKLYLKVTDTKEDENIENLLNPTYVSKDNLSLITESDDSYLILDKGDEALLEFAAPRLEKGYQRKIGFAAEGYYIEIQDPDPESQICSLIAPFQELSVFQG